MEENRLVSSSCKPERGNDLRCEERGGDRDRRRAGHGVLPLRWGTQELTAWCTNVL